jgi:hypothetical protein
MSYRLKLVVFLLVLIWPVTVALSANVNDFADAHDSKDGQVLIQLTDVGWVGGSETSDCAPDYNGWGDDEWELTLNSPQDVYFSIVDCCCTGDFYEAYINGCLFGTTPDPAPAWGCNDVGANSADTFLLSLPAGVYLFQVRDAAFDTHTDAEIEDENMCPAGYTVEIVLDDYTGSPSECVCETTCPPDTVVPSLGDLPPCDPDDFQFSESCGPMEVVCWRSSVAGVGCTDIPIDVLYTYTATDQSGVVRECSRTVTVLAPYCPIPVVSIADAAGIVVRPGAQVTIPVTLTTDNHPIRELNLHLGYDPSAISLIAIERGEALSKWEHFTYRLGPTPTGESSVRLSAVADLDNGGTHPPSDAYMPRGTIAYLTFQVTTDRNLVGIDIPVAVMDGGTENIIINKSRTIAFVGELSDVESIRDLHANKMVVPTLQFESGSIRIIAPNTDIGDINRNGIASEIGDAILLARYQTHGDAALSSDPPVRAAQIAASDINNDGVMLSVGDLVYLVRILTGEASPSGAAKVSPYVASGSVSQSVAHGTMSVSTSATVELGGGLFVFRTHDNTVGTPSLSAAASGMTLSASVRNGELRVLVSTDPRASRSARLPSGRNELFSVPVEGNGRVELIESQLSDADGALLSIGSAASVRRPEGYALQQNHPNPFNAGTVIPFEMGDAGDWTVRVYNVAGQMIRSFSGTAGGHGLVNVSWDGTDQNGRPVGSGMYLYRVVAGEFTATRKMILLK